MYRHTVEESGAFVERFSVPATGDGPLNGLHFAVKDLVDVAGHRTGCGNPTWLETHPPATVSALCVDQLLAAGAQCEGKTITDEIAFSLLGKNHFYGTPLNPAAPERVPGGSSSGSASAVACGLVDFAIGTDTGGSVRVPASNCGIWGWRPTHGVVSVAGVMPLAPMFDTVGILANSVEVLGRAARVLLAADMLPDAEATKPTTIRLVSETFNTADVEVRDALQPAIEFVERLFNKRFSPTPIEELCGDASASDWNNWRDIYRRLVGAEVLSCHGGWLATEHPALGPITEAGFEHAKTIDRARLAEVISRRERYAVHLRRALGPRDLLCIPTAPSVAPLKSTSLDRNSNYYHLTVAFNAIAGVGRLPQVSMPLGMACGAPIGLSLIGAHGEDAFVLNVANAIGSQWAVP